MTEASRVGLNGCFVLYMPLASLELVWPLHTVSNSQEHGHDIGAIIQTGLLVCRLLIDKPYSIS